MPSKSCPVLVPLVLAAVMPARVTECTGFHEVSNWAAFDPGDHGVGTDPDGYWGAVFDGRYVYFSPNLNEMQPHGEVLRHDTFGDFNHASSWDTYDPSANGLGDDAKGFVGAVFDGRYVYFTPRNTALRLDTTGDFFSPASWTAFSPADNDVGNNPIGYIGAVFDGRYVYFAPNHNGTEFHGEVLRYDTTQDFSVPDSWATFDPDLHDVGEDPDGYHFGVFDGRYVYFAPSHNGTDFHGEVLRYDTMGNFSSPSSWTTFDPGANGLEGDLDGYEGAVFDGRYVYFGPGYNGTSYHNVVLRYDTHGEFTALGSWSTSDPSTHGVCSPTMETHGLVLDGRYVYLVPFYANGQFSANVVRYDTHQEFTGAGAWESFDADAQGVGDFPVGYHDGLFDGRYVYFCPVFDGIEEHAEVLRYDTHLGEPIPAVSEWNLAVMTLLLLTAGTIVAMRMGYRARQV